MKETVLDPLLTSKEQVEPQGWGPGHRCSLPAQPRLPSVTLGGCREDPGTFQWCPDQLGWGTCPRVGRPIGGPFMQDLLSTQDFLPSAPLTCVLGHSCRGGPSCALRGFSSKPSLHPGGQLYLTLCCDNPKMSADIVQCPQKAHAPSLH